MSMNSSPRANRVHIGFFGKRNSGKSSLVNAFTSQQLAVVSDVKGTTTDPVYKSMELLPIGPVVVIDTAGIDDEGALGKLRVDKSRQVLNKTDIAILVVDGTIGLDDYDKELIGLFNEKGIGYLVVYNKTDLMDIVEIDDEHSMAVSALTGANIEQLKKRIAAMPLNNQTKLRIVGDIINPGDFVVLVTPIDKAAPQGRLILPQQQTIRDILEADATAIVVKEHELRATLENLGKKPKLVVTDSQVFAKAAADTPTDVALTSFSILFARFKGVLKTAVKGAKALDSLSDGATILISEGCTHHRQCDDIGTVKLPRWIKNYSQASFNFEFTSGGEFPEDLSIYALIVHCGGCMLNEREVIYRQKCAQDQGIPFTNYGTLIAYMQGILERSVAMFPEIAMELED